MDDINYGELDPLIRHTVFWLRSKGFETTDSGDGVSKPREWFDSGEALDFPHVFMTVSADVLTSEARRLVYLLSVEGIDTVALSPDNEPSIQATYDPSDGSAYLALYGVDDRMFLG